MRNQGIVFGGESLDGEVLENGVSDGTSNGLVAHTLSRDFPYLLIPEWTFFKSSLTLSNPCLTGFCSLAKVMLAEFGSVRCDKLVVGATTPMDWNTSSDGLSGLEKLFQHLIDILDAT